MIRKGKIKNSRGKALVIAMAVASVCGLSMGASVYGESPVSDGSGNSYLTSDNTNITGKGNTVTKGKNAIVVGDKNSVSDKIIDGEGRPRGSKGSEDNRLVGSNNKLEGSRRQLVLGDNNTLIARDGGTVTDYEHPEGRKENAADLTIGSGNFIRGADTYRNEWDSLKVIGNHNMAKSAVESAGGPWAGIVIGDNQNIDTIKESVVIGSLSPKEQDEASESDSNDKKNVVGPHNVVIGYHTISSGGGSVVIGNLSKADSMFQTIVGNRSTIERGKNEEWVKGGTFSSALGAFNSMENMATETEAPDNIGNVVTGSLNRTAGSTGTMIIGAGNVVTHAKAPDYPVDSTSVGYLLAQGASIIATGLEEGKAYMPEEKAREYYRDYMTTVSGAVSILGSDNSVDYAIRSQISGTHNKVSGAKEQLSAYNTVSGYGNTGNNINRTAIIGTGNSIKNGEDNIVIGDFHEFDGSKHNVVLGSVASEEQDVDKTAQPILFGGPINYKVKTLVPTRRHKVNIENAVMLGYNTDVTQNGGVALGSESLADRDKGMAGYDPASKGASTDESPTWKSTAAAVSVGDSTKAQTRQITNVAAGSEDTDAVNVAQLKRITSDSSSTINKRIDEVDGHVTQVYGRLDTVGAGLAALAALHPLDYDPAVKWDFTAGYGRYHAESSVALGAFYRPNENMQLSIGSTLYGGETLFNIGLSVKAGSGNATSQSRGAMAKEIQDLKRTVAMQGEQIQKLMALLQEAHGTDKGLDLTTVTTNGAHNH